MSGLAVWMYGTQVGVLSRQRGELSFAHTPEALELGVGRPLLSVSMPTRARRYNGAVPHAFFDGLLPEGDPRRMIAYDLGLSEHDIYSLLRALGRDCAGALVVVPDGETLDEEGVPEPLSEAEVAARLRALRIAPLGVDQRVRVSLAGMQQKLLLSRLDEGWGLPVDGAPSTHIVKPAHAFLRDVIANEAVCMRIARHLGVPVAEVEVADFDGVSVLIIERYDRTAPDEQGRVVRLHQEDFGQAHSLDRRRKYEVDGGLSLRQCAETLERWSAEPDQLEQLLDITTLNVLIGNADAHAKNLSLLHGRDGRVQLAPAYDLMATTFYPDVNATPGMLVDGVRDITTITRDNLIREGTSWGLSLEAAAARVEQVVAGAEEAIADAADAIDCPAELVELLYARARSLAP